MYRRMGDLFSVHLAVVSRDVDSVNIFSNSRMYRAASAGRGARKQRNSTGVEVGDSSHSWCRTPLLPPTCTARDAASAQRPRSSKSNGIADEDLTLFPAWPTQDQPASDFPSFKYYGDLDQPRYLFKIDINSCGRPAVGMTRMDATVGKRVRIPVDGPCSRGSIAGPYDRDDCRLAAIECPIPARLSYRSRRWHTTWSIGQHAVRSFDGPHQSGCLYISSAQP